MGTESFSLVKEPWIRVEDQHGETRVLSLQELFDGSVGVRALRGDSDTQDYAVLRVLLAIFWRAYARTIDEDDFLMLEWFSDVFERAETEPDHVVLDYLSDHEERFNLLDSTAPFMQVADLRTKKGIFLPISRMVADAESDYFTLRAGPGIETLSFAEAARWLVHLQAFDYSGIKSGAIGDPRVKNGKGYPIGTGWTGMTGGTYLVGASLRQTLALNTTPECLGVGLAEEDVPVWERTPDTAEPRGPKLRAGEKDPGVMPTGPIDLATWQSRRVRLFHDGQQVTGVLVSNGDKIPDAGLNVFGDPMTPYRFSSNKSKSNFDAYYPAPYDTSRTMWRSLEPLVSADGDDAVFISGAKKNVKSPIRPAVLDQVCRYRDAEVVQSPVIPVRMVSMNYGDQNSSFASTVSFELGLPFEVLLQENLKPRRVLLSTASATYAAALNLGQFAGNLLVAAGGEYEFQSASMDALLARLEPVFSQWVSALTDSEEVDGQAVQWQQYVEKRVLEDAVTLIKGAGPKATIGRPDPRSTQEPPVILNSATAYTRLQRQLKKSLPLTNQDRKEDSHAS